ncbi:hypothetical protein Pfo_003427 [Paulownia fortunei]|nr:hypothetical protein Pfo_003427 [Paulownia fortunei]
MIYCDGAEKRPDNYRIIDADLARGRLFLNHGYDCGGYAFSIVVTWSRPMHSLICKILVPGYDQFWTFWVSISYTYFFMNVLHIVSAELNKLLSTISKMCIKPWDHDDNSANSLEYPKALT